MNNTQNPTYNVDHKSYSNLTSDNEKTMHNKRVRLTITDLSRMGENRVCIFGVDADSKYIRPIIPFEHIQKRHLYDDDGNWIVKPFAMVDFDLIKPFPQPPHNEDYIMNPDTKPIFVRNLDNDEILNFLGSILDDDVKSIFGARIFNNKFIPEHLGTRSIGTVKIEKLKKLHYNTKNGSLNHKNPIL